MLLEEIFSLNNWKKINFDDVRPELARTLLCYLGKFEVVAGKTPRTDGHKIELSSLISEFEDDKNQLWNNRNVSMYIADLCHEISHIIGGAFVVDFAEYSQEHFDQPKIAKTILNIIRDRCDEDNFKAKFALHNDKSLMVNSNRYFVKKRPLPKDRANKFLEIYSTKVIAGVHKAELLPEQQQETARFLAQEVTSKKLKQEGIACLGDLLDRLLDISVFERQTLDAGKECLEATEQVYNYIMEEFKDMPKKPSSYSRGGEHGEGKIKIANKQDLKANAEKIRKSAEEIKAQIEQAKKDALKEKQEAEKNTEIEYDNKRRTYSQKAKVYDKIITEQDWGFINHLEKYRTITEEIISYLYELKPNQLQLKQRTNEPDEMNIEAVLEVIADHSLRYDGRIYDSVEINKRDYAVNILIDSSGSTSQEINGGTVLDIEKCLAGILYQSLTEIGDKVKLYSYESDPDTRVYFIPGLENLGVLKPTNANRDGAAIRRTTKHLLEEEAKDRWLIIVADGKPAANNYGGEYALEDTTRAIAEAEDKGVRVIYLNVDNVQPEYFGKLTNTATYARWFNSVKDLPKFAYELVTEVMAL